MILPNGRFCLISAKFVTGDGHWAGAGHLVLHAEHWRDQADHDANPDKPRAAHDHFMGFGKAVCASEDVSTQILTLLMTALDADGNGYCEVNLAQHGMPGIFDPKGVLFHPHVAALEVTPRE